MSTIHDRPATKPPDLADDDPFRYGWRYVRRTRPDGTEEFDQLPLTLEDVLHPEEEDFRVQSKPHNDDCRYLADVLETWLAGDASAVVLSDCRVDWGVPGLRAHGPDVAVFVGVKRKRGWGTFYVAAEGARPVLVIEITSPDTRSTDLVDKVEHYERAGIPLYAIVDAKEGPTERRLRLLGYRLGPDGYEPMPLDDRGRLWLEPIGLWLDGSGPQASLIDGATGQEIPGYARMAEARAAAEARAVAESQARAAAETRIRELEAELRRSRGES